MLNTTFMARRLHQAMVVSFLSLSSFTIASPAFAASFDSSIISGNDNTSGNDNIPSSLLSPGGVGLVKPIELPQGLSWESYLNDSEYQFVLLGTSASVTNANSQSVPEPLTTLGSILAVGFGLMLKRKDSKKA
ncbi:PEP-CTERM sorting domain-containing protein [Nostoc sp. UHCC 0870]|uniref:PEP-CTERM sorting domain-containing protein n=1 Tax=Nostoc sp. UHCC 0870 TaxID=2914041 RepID=UPI001EDDA7F7|nr:PEP-CTERM sorting domain-containing protein [Nostoc sp. UHCC 0870]UKO97844.1 PEP-CTERM sorting domain-containing protein [Nostoc sp. UHCC 0870]